MSEQASQALAQGRVVLVGCGGTGQLIASCLGHLGLGAVDLWDPDVLDPTSFNRWPLAPPAAVGQPKVAVLRDHLRQRFPAMQIRVSKRAFPDGAATNPISGAALVITALDNAEGRIEVDVLSRGYGVTLVDVGCGMVQQGSKRGFAGGQVAVSRQDGPCLQCLGFELGLDNGYVLGGAGAAPASSLPLNMTLAGMTAEVVIQELAGDLGPVNLVRFDARTLTAESCVRHGAPRCSVCGGQGRTDIAMLRLHPLSGY